MMRRLFLYTLLIALLGGLAACAPAADEPVAADRPLVVTGTPTAESDDASPTLALIENAEAVFLGQVSFISATRQDENGRVYHQVALSVLETGIDELNIGAGIILTVPGPSPLHDDSAAHQLNVGDDVVVLARQEKMGPALTVTPVSEQAIMTADQWDSVMAAVVGAGTTQ